MPERSEGSDITRLLHEWRGGSPDARDRLIPLVYRELHALASRYLSRERRDHILQTTALVNEAFVKLSGQRDVDWQNRAHFFGIAAQLMRRILVDHARRQGSAKRGGRAPQLPFDDQESPSRAPAVEAIDAYALDRSLSRLEALDPRQGRVVELRFFGGLTNEETALVMGLSPATVKREWTVARAWLHRDLTGEGL
jgi:RNA polymerase sigma factor (TIGR02999 family)